MFVLGIESSCDDTAASVLDFQDPQSFRILSSVVSSQIDVHSPHGGVVPELAARQHLKNIGFLVKEAIEQCRGDRLVAPADLDGIAVTHRPGLLGALFVGLAFAKSYAWSLKKPFIGVSHLEAHLNAPFLESTEIPFPHTALLVSGGHTALYACRSFGDYQLLSSTRDDAAGEAFDKVAKILGLGYPGGPVIDRMAKKGNARAIDFPRGHVRGRPLDFSFSGLKTAVRHYCSSAPQHDSTSAHVSDICASFQEAVVDSLVEKTMAANEQVKGKAILLTGGVACNSRLREVLSQAAAEANAPFYVSSPKYCTDNAAMVAYVGARRLANGESSGLDLDAVPTEMMRGPAKSGRQ